MSNNEFDCDYCKEYCGDTRRLHVKVPPKLVKDLLKDRPDLEGKVKIKYFNIVLDRTDTLWLCDKCVKAYCKDTISDYWFTRYFPRGKRDGIPV